MPSTVYKGDLAEVAFGQEAGILLEVDKIDGATITIAAGTLGDDSTKFTFAGTAATANSPFTSGGTEYLRYPKGMLIGSRLVVIKATSAIDDLDEYATSGRIFNIIENTADSMQVTPKMKSSTGALGTGDALYILPFKTPAIDVATVYHANPTTSTESVTTDQFLGLTSALTLPETKVDLKRYHVVGLGRDVSVQVPGKFITEGGSFEVAMHTARWLKYCLGQELVYDIPHQVSGTSANNQTAVTLSAAANAGDCHLDLSVAAANIYFNHGGTADAIAIGDYVYIRDTTDVPIVSDHEPDAGSWDGQLDGVIFDDAQKQEVRRIVAMAGSRIFLNEPLQHSHANSHAVHFLRYRGNSTDIGKWGGPFFDNTNKGLLRTVHHLLYSKAYLPSFALECSIRRRDEDSDAGTVDGGSGDSKELTRVYRGCKVSDFTLTADTDAALKLSVNFNAALCYTDTGRLEATNPHSRYNAHRMFDDTASTDVNRYVAGIGKGTQKPFLFYNGRIKVAGQTVAQVTTFSLTGSTGIQSLYSINGNTATSAATDQVPFGGSRNATTIVEGQTTYEMTMEIIVDDPLFFHKMRTAEEFTEDADKQVVLDFEKTTTSTTLVSTGVVINNGAGYSSSTTSAMTVDAGGGSGTAVTKVGIGETLYTSTGAEVGKITAMNAGGTTITMAGGTVTTVADDEVLYRKLLPETMTVVMDDYYIIEAPLQIPEDKGPLKSTLKIMPKTIKVMSRDSILQY